MTEKMSAADQWSEAQKRKEAERRQRTTDEQRRREQASQTSATTVAALRAKAAKKREEAAEAARAVAKALVGERARQDRTAGKAAAKTFAEKAAEKAEKKTAEKTARAAKERQEAGRAAVASRTWHVRAGNPTQGPIRGLARPVRPGTHSYELVQKHAARMDVEQRAMFVEELRRNGIEIRPAVPRADPVRRRTPAAAPAPSAGAGRPLPELERERYADPVPDPAVAMAAELRDGGAASLPPGMPRGRDDDDEWRPHDRSGPYGQRRRRRN
ncbi:hypothetical protein ACFV0O_40770 [Kitasatospora sp. NPDC059577]|uniref:hypothetical protein n=1 Tax=Kitasatospora sp. NPDC059577 TaxID=3346873 RepID=UPI00367AC6BB